MTLNCLGGALLLVVRGDLRNFHTRKSRKRRIYSYLNDEPLGKGQESQRRRRKRMHTKLEVWISAMLTNTVYLVDAAS